jgi:Protein of unknown function (DUF1501)
MEVPEIVNIENESAAVKKLYGLGEKETDAFGRRCLLARRLVEKGVRFVQVYSSGWDSHDDIATAHANRMRAVDKPIAGLLTDLKRMGLLENTSSGAENSVVLPTTACGWAARHTGATTTRKQ